MFGNYYDSMNDKSVFDETQTNLTDSTTSRTGITQMSNRNDKEETTMEYRTYSEHPTNNNALAEQIQLVNTTEFRLPSLDEAFAKNNRDHKSMFNKLTVSNDDHEHLYSEEVLEKVYNEELVGRAAFRFNPNKTKISDLTGWKVDDGCGIISIRSTPNGFFYTDGSSPIGFKARLGYSQSLKRNICIVQLFNGRFVVPDYLFFRGYLTKDKKDFSRNLNLSYITVTNHLSYDSTCEYPDSEACDSFFRILALALMGELDNR